MLEQKTANPELYDRLGVEDVAAATPPAIAVTLTAPGRDCRPLILGNAVGTK